MEKKLAPWELEAKKALQVANDWAESFATVGKNEFGSLGWEAEAELENYMEP